MIRRALAALGIVATLAVAVPALGQAPEYCGRHRVTVAAFASPVEAGAWRIAMREAL
jgi:hypothetical protein